MSTKSAALENEMKVRTRKSSKWLRFYRCLPLYLMFLPGALYLLMDRYAPMTGLVIAFKKINWRKGIFGSDWIGFSNFTYLFKTKDAFNITRNTILYNLAFIVLGTLLAISIAIILNEITSKKMKQFIAENQDLLEETMHAFFICCGLPESTEYYFENCAYHTDIDL